MTKKSVRKGVEGTGIGEGGAKVEDQTDKENEREREREKDRQTGLEGKLGRNIRHRAQASTLEMNSGVGGGKEGGGSSSRNTTFAPS